MHSLRACIVSNGREGATIKLLIDENIPTSVTKALLDEGFDVIHVRLIKPGIADDEIIEWSDKEERGIVTMDKDFGFLVYNQKIVPHGVLLIRIHPTTSEKTTEIVLEALKGIEDLGIELRGKFIVFDGFKFRIRPL